MVAGRIVAFDGIYASMRVAKTIWCKRSFFKLAKNESATASCQDL
jgi:hypothetical protein